MNQKSLVFVSLLSVPAFTAAYAEVYLTAPETVKVMYPATAAKFVEQEFTLSDDEVKKVETASGESVRDRKLRVWKGPGRELIFIDRVVGKHDFITYAVAIEPADARNTVPRVHQVEILEYRETYGGDVRKVDWRAQFVGKTRDAKLKAGQDIRNLSGATLSSAHVTAGVRRLLQTYEVVHGRG